MRIHFDVLKYLVRKAIPRYLLSRYVVDESSTVNTQPDDVLIQLEHQRLAWPVQSINGGSATLEVKTVTESTSYLLEERGHVYRVPNQNS